MTWGSPPTPTPAIAATDSVAPGINTALLDFVDVAGHQFDVRVAKRFAALVVEGDPADEFEVISFGRSDDVVTGLPSHAAGDVAEFRAGFAGLVGCEFPGERGL